MRPEPRDLVLRVAVAVVALVVVVEAVLLLARDPSGDAGSGQDVAGVRSRVPGPPAKALSRGSYVESQVTADGNVTVKQWVQSKTPLKRLDLTLPALADTAGTVRATDVLVAADRVVLDRTGTVDATGRRVNLGGPTSEVYLRYTLRGLVDRSTSARRRALAQALSLDVRPLTGPSRVVVVGDNVRSVACTREQGAEPRPCGAPTTNGWRVLLRGPRRSSVVQAQVELG